MDWLYVSSIITALHSRHDGCATVPPFLEVEALAFKLNLFREKKFHCTFKLQPFLPLQK